MKPPRPSRAGIAVVLVLALMAPRGDAIGQPADDGRKTAARAAYEDARRAADRGQWQAALQGFVRAMELRPAPRLHHAIAVCHHQLALAQPAGSTTAAEHQKQAIDAYNRYLETVPGAADRKEVEQAIVELGGRPVTMDEGWFQVERIDPGDEGPPPAPALHPASPAPAGPPGPAAPIAPVANATPTAVPVPAPPREPRGWLDVGFAVVVQQPAKLAGNDDVEGLPLLGAVLGGGGFLGARRRAMIGGEIGFALATAAHPHRHGLSAGHIGLSGGHRFVLGKRERLELTLGGLLALTGQTLTRRRPPGDEARCPIDDAGDAVSQRGGLWIAPRAGVGVRLGPRRRHVLWLRLTPGIAIVGRGSHGGEAEVCRGDDPAGGTPFEQFGLGRRLWLSATADLGYSARF